MNIIKVLHTEMTDVLKYLASQPSMQSNLEKYLPKVYALAMASYFEKQLQDIIMQYVSRKSGGSSSLESFVRKRAITLQYHTYFDWGKKDQIGQPGKNANAFFAMFGDDVKEKIQAEVREDASLDKAVQSFLEIGHIRNILVHSNFAAFNFVSKTTDELFTLFEEAERFVEYVRSKFDGM
jgi:hypothetical protein